MRLFVRYDGTHFRGFANNPGVRTVAGVLEAALHQILAEQIQVTCAGRTDAGVHARGQVVSFSTTSTRLDIDRLARSLTSMLSPDVVIPRAEFATDGFSARHDAIWRRYRYLVDTQASPDPLERHTVWHVGMPLRVDLMNQAAAILIGRHDFSSFCRRPQVPVKSEPASLVRTVLSANWETGDAERLEFGIVAESFCQQMVRSIVGTLVEVGKGKRIDIQAILDTRDRNAGTLVAPPHGLSLEEVGYE